MKTRKIIFILFLISQFCICDVGCCQTVTHEDLISDKYETDTIVENLTIKHTYLSGRLWMQTYYYNDTIFGTIIFSNRKQVKATTHLGDVGVGLHLGINRRAKLEFVGILKDERIIKGTYYNSKGQVVRVVDNRPIKVLISNYSASILSEKGIRITFLNETDSIITVPNLASRDFYNNRILRKDVLISGDTLILNLSRKYKTVEKRKLPGTVYYSEYVERVLKPGDSVTFDVLLRETDLRAIKHVELRYYDTLTAITTESIIELSRL